MLSAASIAEGFTPPPPISITDFRRLFEAVPGLYLVLDPNLCIVAASDAYLHATMTTRETIVGRCVFEVFPDNPDDPTASGERHLRGSLERVLRECAADSMAILRYDIRRPETAGGGFEERHWRPTNSPLLGADNRVAYIIHQVEDVTELVLARRHEHEQEKRAAVLDQRCRELDHEVRLRARELQILDQRLSEATADLDRTRREVRDRTAAEAALRDSERRYRAFFDVTTAGVVEVTVDAVIIRANAAFCRMLGYTVEEMAGKPVVDLLPSEEREEMLAQYRRFVAEQAPSFEAERRYLRKAGGTIWAAVSAVRVRTEDGADWVCAVVIDLTAHRNTEEFLRASEERFRLLVDGVRDHAIYMTDPQGRIVTWNSGAERLFGYTSAEVEGRHLEIFHPVEAVTAGGPRRLVDRAAKGGVAAEGWRVRKDGSRFWADTVMTPLWEAPGRLRGLAKIVRDSTERHRLETQFRQAQKMEAVGQLAGGIAHDFNNLLTVITGYSDIILAALPREDPNRDAVVAVREAGERAARLTAQLLAFSRKSIVEPKVLDLNAAVGDSERFLRRLIGEDVSFTTALSPGLYAVSADPGQIEQVLLNLVVNARDSMPRGGRLTIETHNVHLREGDAAYPDLPPGRYVQLAVTDTGVGMTEDVKSRIFEPFFTTKEPGKGTGLGLAMVYGAVKSHRGQISVYSEPAVGTTFKILLPAVSSPVRPQSSVVLPAPRGTETVVLVEDEDAVRTLARLALQMHGYTVLDAGNGAAGLKLAAAHPGPIHLLITDVVMPGISGREVAEAMRAKFPGLRVLYASGYTDDAVVRHGIVAATDAFIQKPFTPMALARKVRSVLDNG